MAAQLRVVKVSVMCPLLHSVFVSLFWNASLFILKYKFVMFVCCDGCTFYTFTLLDEQTCLVYAIGVENYTFEAQTTYVRLHYTNYANDFVLATR